MRIFQASTRVPTILVVAVPAVALLVILWAMAVANDRNPLPFPDRDYHVFSTRTEAGLVVLEEIMQLHGHDPRYRADSEGVHLLATSQRFCDRAVSRLTRYSVPNRACLLRS